MDKKNPLHYNELAHKPILKTPIQKLTIIQEANGSSTAQMPQGGTVAKPETLLLIILI